MCCVFFIHLYGSVLQLQQFLLFPSCFLPSILDFLYHFFFLWPFPLEQFALKWCGAWEIDADKMMLWDLQALFPPTFPGTSIFQKKKFSDQTDDALRMFLSQCIPHLIARRLFFHWVEFRVTGPDSPSLKTLKRAQTILKAKFFFFFSIQEKVFSLVILVETNHCFSEIMGKCNKVPVVETSSSIMAHTFISALMYRKVHHEVS